MLVSQQAKCHATAESDGKFLRKFGCFSKLNGSMGTVLLADGYSVTRWRSRPRTADARAIEGASAGRLTAVM
jgi:hypothetical protein